MTQIDGIDHIDIVVADVDAMSAFFEKVGFIVVRRTDHGGGAVELRFPGSGRQPVLELTPAIDDNGKARPLGLRHMALRVADITETFRDFSARSLPLSGEPRAIAATGRTILNLTDPSGAVLQFVDGE
jgi:catechol 2,3-dioxygenase-like lactoylglutathione lyase family enzyme